MRFVSSSFTGSLWAAVATCGLLGAGVVGVGCLEPESDALLGITVDVEGRGTVTSDPGGVICRGAGSEAEGVCQADFEDRDLPVNLTAHPAAGWRFAGWEVEGDNAAAPARTTRETLSIRVDQRSRQQWRARFEELPRPDAGTPVDSDGGADGGTVDAGPTEADLIPMTITSFFGTRNLYSVAWFPPGTLDGGAARPGVYVAGTMGRVVRTPDGATFTGGDWGGMRGRSALAASPDLLINIDYNDVYGSSDAATFTKLGTIPDADYITSVVWAGTQFIAVGADTSGTGIISTSPDAVTWTTALIAPAAGRIFSDILWNGSLAVVVGAAGSIVTSTDGATWTIQDSPTAADLKTVASNGTSFVAIGGPAGATVAITSTDAQTWSISSATFPAETKINGLTAAGSIYVAVGTEGRHFTSADDGATFLREKTQPTTVDLNDVSAAGPFVIEIGNSANIAIGPQPE